MQPAVVPTIQKQPNANTLEVTEAIEKTLADLKPSLPPDVVVDTKAFQQADFIKRAIGNVKLSLIEGGIIEEITVKNFYQYTGPSGQTLHGYERQYKGSKLRKKGFVSKSDADRDLRQAMNDLDAAERGEIRTKPTTAQEALKIYRHNLEVRARDKDYQYAHNVISNCKILQEFVDHFGPNRLIRECTETNLREFYQILCFRPSLNKNSAGVFIGRVQGMLQAAQKAKPDLVNWLRPTLKVNRTPEFERRVVEPWEYAALVNILLNPTVAPSRRLERNALWREAADSVQLLRMTGGRLNEILRMKLD